VEQGEFLYYIVIEGTNTRKENEDTGSITIYSSREVADLDCGWQEEVISVAAYNRTFGDFGW